MERISRLVDDALRDPTTGIVKPEPLLHSRRMMVTTGL
ncbi:hypothetical protein [Ferrimicrobium acidiphilum]